MAVRKGQMFIIGALIFSGLLLSIVAAVQGGQLFYTGGDQAMELAERTANEFPAVLNTGLERDADVHEVKRDAHSFLKFQSRSARQRGMEMKSYAVILIPNSTGVNAVISGFGRETGFRLEVSGDSRQFYLEPGTTREAYFDGVEGGYRVEVSVEPGAWNRVFHASTARARAASRVSVSTESETWVETRVY